MKLTSLLKILGAIAAFLCASTIVLLFLYKSSVNEERVSILREAELQELGHKMAMASDLLTREVRSYAQFGNMDHYQNYWTEVNETKTRDKVIERLIELNVPQEALEYLETAKANSDALIQLETDAMIAVVERDFQLARQLLFGEAYTMAKESIMNPVGKFQSFISSWSSGLTASAQNASNNYLMFVQISILLLIGVFVISFFLLISRLTPLNALSNSLEDLTSKEGDLTKRLPDEGTDEVGTLSKLFNSFVASLEKMISNIQGSGMKVYSSSSQITASTRQLEGTITEHVATINQIVGATKEISATSTELVNTMNEVVDMSEKTTQSATEGDKAISQMDDVMRVLKDSLGAISDKLSLINDKTMNISKIVLTIEKISEQTNLLSLNAAIEAEKAGEYGKGFGIVAREMRKLADKTDVATLDIQKIVKEMKSAVSEGVMSMDKFTVDVLKGVNEVNVASEVMSKVIDGVQELLPRFESVNEGVNSQSEGAAMIKESIIELNKAAKQTSSSLKETSEAISQLNEAARDLESEVGRFKTN